MHKITKKYETETGHRLLDYDGKCAHLHGHRYQWEVTIIHEELDVTGFVIDFKDLKAVMEQVLEPYDHALVLHKDDPLLIGGTNRLRAANDETARLILLDVNPTVENLTRIIGEELSLCFENTTYHIERVKCHETSNSYAEWVNPVVRVSIND